MTKQPSDETTDTARNVLGTAALFAGVGLLGLNLLHETFRLPLPMPGFWYVNRPLWLLLSLASIVIGWRLLQHRPPAPTAWRPSRPGARFHQLTIYTRPQCHLCDDAQELLAAYGRYLPQIEEVNIDLDPHLEEQFGTCVPVVEIDGKIRFRGKVDEGLLRRLIQGTGPIA